MSDVESALRALAEAVNHWRAALELAATRTKQGNLNRYQRAVADQMPSCGNIIQGIECLLQNRLLFAAKVLTRPLLERTANMSYFRIKREAAWVQWEEGWKLGSRPNLEKRMACFPDKVFKRRADGSIGQEANVPQVRVELFRRIEKLHGVIHGDLDSLHETINYSKDGLDYHTIGIDNKNIRLLQDIAHLAIVLTMFGVFEIESAFVETSDKAAT